MTREALHTPVAFLVFNRPDTTARVFEAIRAARPGRLLVVADGPRPERPGEAERCAEVRAIIDRVDWPCEVHKAFSDVNLGCGRRISSGLSWVFEQEERAIILEDDCLPHPDFFRFCETLLDRYADDERVMMIGGTNFLSELDLAESFCFSRYFAIWGWATWRRAWAKYDVKMTRWPALRESEQLASFYRQPFMREHLIRMFDAVHRGEIDTWDVQWFHACLFNNALSVTPRRNLISNIGLEGVHTAHDHDHSYHELPVFGLDPGELVGPPLMFPERRYDDAMFARQFMKKRKTLGARVARAARRVFTRGTWATP